MKNNVLKRLGSLCETTVVRFSVSDITMSYKEEASATTVESALSRDDLLLNYYIFILRTTEISNSRFPTIFNFFIDCAVLLGYYQILHYHDTTTKSSRE